jgi:hypothetical protein
MMSKEDEDKFDEAYKVGRKHERNFVINMCSVEHERYAHAVFKTAHDARLCEYNKGRRDAYMDVIACLEKD